MFIDVHWYIATLLFVTGPENCSPLCQCRGDGSGAVDVAVAIPISNRVGLSQPFVANRSACTYIHCPHGGEVRRSGDHVSNRSAHIIEKHARMRSCGCASLA